MLSNLNKSSNTRQTDHTCRATMIVNFMFRDTWMKFHVSTWLCPDIWSDIILGVSAWECFGMSLTFKSVNWVMQIALPNVGRPHLIHWRPEYNKRADPPQNKEAISPAWLPWGWEVGFLLPSDSNWNISSSWVLSLLAFRLEVHHPLFRISPLPTHPEEPGTCQPP